MTGFSAANRSPLVGIVILFLLTLHGFRTKIQHFATKAIFEMGSIKFSIKSNYTPKTYPLQEKFSPFRQKQKNKRPPSKRRPPEASQR